MAKPSNKPLFEIAVLDEPNEPADNLPSTSVVWDESLERTQQRKIELHETFATALLKDFKAHGVEAIHALREKNPASYIKIIKDFLPREISIDVTQRHDASKELVQISRLQLLRSLIERADGDRRADDGPTTADPHLPPADERAGQDGSVFSADDYLEQKGLLPPVDT